MKAAFTKKAGTAIFSLTCEDGRFTKSDVRIIENPDTFKKLNAGVPKKG